MYIFNNSSTPLYIQLYEQIKKEIETKLSAKTKLPAIRKMANEYKISKNTVQLAYTQLQIEGYIESKPQSGYYVCEDIINQISPNNDPFLKNHEQKIIDYKFDFFPAHLSKDSFPIKLWTKLYNKTMHSNLDFGKYQDPQGDLQLRTQILDYLSKFRGVSCSVEQIVICSGFSDSMFIVSTLLRTFTKTIGIENPGYFTSKKIFEQQQYKIKDIDVTKEGVNLNTIEKSNIKLLYLTPSHQFPTGVTIPISNRLKLLNWAIKTNSYIIEDDYDSELSYYNRPIPSLQGLKENQNIIYLGTFSKILSPALRVSYLVLPKPLLELYKKEFYYHFSGVPLDIQKTLELFIKEGYLEKHIRKIRTINKKNHDLLKNLLLKHLNQSIKILREGSGLALIIKPTVKINWEKLNKLAKEENIKIYPMTYTKNQKTLAMGFGGFSEQKLIEAVEIFIKIWEESLIK